MLWKRGLITCGAWILGATALGAIALTLKSTAALSPFGIHRFSGSVVGILMFRTVAPHAAAVATWLGVVAATDINSWRRIRWLIFAAIVPLTLVSIGLAIPIALLVALAHGVGPSAFWTNTIQSLLVTDLVVGLVRSGVFALVLYYLARLLLGYLHTHVHGPYWKLVVAWLVVGCALVSVDVIGLLKQRSGR